ncbi:protein translocase subunit SecF [Candidatus Gottesmanbacteria bacterium]|nr:protein translocase subunit SecF [Candidatus Gottesmanbacteria bacterium]
MINIIDKKWLFFLISGLTIIPGLIALSLWGLNLSQDFTGGSLIELKVEKAKPNDLKNLAQKAKLKVVSIQETQKGTFLIRTDPIDQKTNKSFQKSITKKYQNIEELRFETIGPTIGRETTEKAIQGVIIASIAIIGYITLAFRKIPKGYSSWKFGICAVAALIHDILVVVGVFSIFGHFGGVEIDSLFITALLTIMGFSVHDTIVVFDRIRENLIKMAGKSFSDIVNEAILQTLARSLSTSLTVLFTLTALLLFGGESIKWFIVALLIGIISGTYSSIFNAAPLLVIWEEWKKKK